MANIVVIPLSIVLIFFTAAQGSKTTHTIEDSGNQLGICKGIVEPQHYSCEEHSVTTGDGFILSMQRMQAGKSGKKADKPPVILWHGLVSDAVTWLVMPPNESLAYILADSGFDVWLANGRGTKYSSAHTSLNPSQWGYWEWSWDELVKYDLPATVGYVYKSTGNKKMHYVGNSLGTLMVLAALSEGQVVNMLRSAALLAPIAHLNQVTSVAVQYASRTFLFYEAYWLGIRKIIPQGDPISKFMTTMCAVLGLDCSNLMNYITGPNCCIDSKTMAFYRQNEPQPTSTKNLIHLSQMVQTGRIGKFDYGVINNTKFYGQPTPPVYDMTKIPKDFPLFLSYGGRDMLADANDVQSLLKDLSGHNRNNIVTINNPNYAHLDFIMAYTAKQVVYDSMISFFDKN